MIEKGCATIMDKVLVEICIPAVGGCFDIFAPIDAPIQVLTGVIADGVAELTSGEYVVSGAEFLCMREPTGLLDPSLTLQDYGIKDGTRLFLI